MGTYLIRCLIADSLTRLKCYSNINKLGMTGAKPLENISLLKFGNFISAVAMAHPNMESTVPLLFVTVTYLEMYPSSITLPCVVRAHHLMDVSAVIKQRGFSDCFASDFAALVSMVDRSEIN